MDWQVTIEPVKQKSANPALDLPDVRSFPARHRSDRLRTRENLRRRFPAGRPHGRRHARPPVSPAVRRLRHRGVRQSLLRAERLPRGSGSGRAARRDHPPRRREGSGGARQAQPRTAHGRVAEHAHAGVGRAPRQGDGAHGRVPAHPRRRRRDRRRCGRLGLLDAPRFRPPDGVAAPDHERARQGQSAADGCGYRRNLRRDPARRQRRREPARHRVGLQAGHAGDQRPRGIRVQQGRTGHDPRAPARRRRPCGDRRAHSPGLSGVQEVRSRCGAHQQRVPLDDGGAGDAVRLRRRDPPGRARRRHGQDARRGRRFRFGDPEIGRGAGGRRVSDRRHRRAESGATRFAGAAPVRVGDLGQRLFPVRHRRATTPIWFRTACRRRAAPAEARSSTRAARWSRC